MNFSAKSLGTIKYFFLTLVILLIPIGYYFFYYVPSRQSYYTSRNLRLLAEISANLTSRIGSYHGWIDYLTLDNDFVDSTLSARLDIKNAAALRQNPAALATAARDISPYISTTLFNRLGDLENLSVQHFNFAFDWEADATGDASRRDSTSSEIRFTSSSQHGEPLLHLYYAGTRQNPNPLRNLDRYHVTVTGQVQLRRLMQPLLHEEIFDDILIFENDAEGRVVYQQHRNEFVATRMDSISAKIKRTHASAHDQVRLSNAAYKLYVHPVQIADLIEAANDFSLDKFKPAAEDSQPIEWTVVGLVKASRFNAECRSISHYKILLFLFVSLIFFVSLPLIKLKFIGPLEEVTRLDLTLAITAIFFSAGIITFLLIAIFSNKDDEKHLDYTLAKLGENVKGHFYHELDEIYQQVDSISSRLAQTNDLLFKEIQNNRASKGVISSCVADKRVWRFPADVFPYFTQIAWLSRGAGKQVLKLDPDKNATPLVNVSHRDYYQKMNNDQGWQRTFRTGPATGDTLRLPYYIQPLISFTNGEKSAVVCFDDPYHANYLIAATVTFRSLRHVITPGMFGFCIIDNSGAVMFHSDDEKSLRENFLRETDHNPRLAAALFSRASLNTTAAYGGRESRINVSPIRDTEWFLITFVQLSNIHSAELSATVLSFTLFLGLLVWYALLFYVFRLIFPRKNFAWLLPRPAMDAYYRFYFVTLFFLSGLYFVVTFLVDERLNLILALLAPPVNLLLMYLVLQTPKLSARFEDINRPISKTVRYILLVVVLIASLVVFQQNHISLAYLLFALFLGFFFLSDAATILLQKYKMPAYYINYMACVVAFLTITSMMPAIGLFRLAYNAEMETLIKNVQLRFVADYAEHQRTLEKDYRDMLIGTTIGAGAPNIAAADNPTFMQARLADTTCTYMAAFQRTTWKTGSDTLRESAKKREPSRLAAILADLRARARIVHYTNWQLYQSGAADNTWRWSYPPNNRLSLAAAQVEKSTALRQVDSSLYPFHPPQNINWAAAMLGLVILLTLLTLYFIRRVLVLDITLPERQEAGELLFDHNIIFIGAHGSGKSTLIDRIPNAFIINFRTLDDVEGYLTKIDYGKRISSDCKTVVLDQFEHGLDDRTLGALKLKLLKRLTGVYRKNVTIVTSVDPIQFLQNHAEMKKDKSWQSAWIHALNSFTQVFHNICWHEAEYDKKIMDYGKVRTKPGSAAQRKKNEDFCRTLIEECNYTPFLRQVGLDMLERFDFAQRFFNKKAFYAEILQRAETYYQSIWEDCAIEEKITLLNLVRNHFFIRKDADFIRILLQKGLLKKTEQFHCFNRSFALFVQNHASTAEVLRWRKEHERNWGNFKTLAVSVVVAIALFIFLTQRETFNQWVALVSTFVAGVPAILKLFSLIDFSALRKKPAASEQTSQV